jgi:hypothetical protein
MDVRLTQLGMAGDASVTRPAVSEFSGISDAELLQQFHIRVIHRSKMKAAQTDARTTGR